MTEFDLLAFLAERKVDRRGLLESPAYRRALTRCDPLMFALVYFARHLHSPDTDEKITFSQFHLDVAEHAKRWIVPAGEAAADRDVWVAPRGVGKSTWWFLIVPAWAAAHGHIKFVAAFADTATQAQTHLKTFRRELQRNVLLRNDYPELCAAAMMEGGKTAGDTQELFIAASEFVFVAKGMDSSSLGLKIDAGRPDLILCDDIEPDESNYSPDQKIKRLSTLVDAVLPMSIYARVVLVGTVTMEGSIVHDAVKTITRPGDQIEPWVCDEHFRTHYYPALWRDDQTGEPVSLWPGKWSVEFLLSIEHTRSFKKNYQNDPMGADGGYWSEEDIRIEPLGTFTHQLLSIDPAVTDKSKSDYTGFAVVALHKPTGKCWVRYARQVRLAPGEPLRAFALAILADYPETSAILVETNQGGDTWRPIFHHMPVRVTTVHQSEPKDVRAARLLHSYQRGKVVHTEHHPDAEGQMVAYPKAPHDDIVDAIGTGVRALTAPPKQKSTSRTYAA